MPKFLLSLFLVFPLLTTAQRSFNINHLDKQKGIELTGLGLGFIWESRIQDSRAWGGEVGIGAEFTNFILIAGENFTVTHTPNSRSKYERSSGILSLFHGGIFYRLKDYDPLFFDVGLRYDLLFFGGKGTDDTIFFPSFVSVGGKAMYGSDWIQVGLRTSAGLMYENRLNPEFVVLLCPLIRFVF